MNLKLNAEDENPLWRNYMDNVDNDSRWMKLVPLLNYPQEFRRTTYATYSEEEFEELISLDGPFKERWGKI